MILRSAALALALSLGFTGMAEAKKKPAIAKYNKHQKLKVKPRKYKANKASKSLSKHRKQRTV